MLFYNIDHVEPNLRPHSKKASAEFFEASASLCRFLAHLEQESAPDAAVAASDAEVKFASAALSFRGLKDLINQSYPYVKDAVREVSFDEAARDVRLSPDSPIIFEIKKQLVRGELDQVLLSCADDLDGFSSDLKAATNRLSAPNILFDVENSKAHELIAKWQAAINRGQFVSAVCLISVAATA